MVAAVGGGRIEHQRDPHINMAVHQVEFRRHDADDLARTSVDFYRPTDEPWITAVCGPPDVVRKDRDAGAIWPRFRQIEPTTVERRHVQRLEELGRYASRVDAAWPVRCRQIRLRDRKPSNVREGTRAPLQLEKFRRRDPELLEPLPRKLARHVDELFGMRVRERLKNDGVDDREDRRVRPDAERQRRDNDERKARRAHERTERVPKVLHERHVRSLDGRGWERVACTPAFGWRARPNAVQPKLRAKASVQRRRTSLTSRRERES